MTFNTEQFDTEAYPNIKEQMLYWVNQFSICSFLDNHHYAQHKPGVECLAAAEAVQVFSQSLFQVDQYLQEKKSWLFGHLNYDLNSTAPDAVGFAPFFFFQPKTILQLTNDRLIIETVYTDPKTIFKAILAFTPTQLQKKKKIQIQARQSKAEYIRNIEKLQAHIQRGDCYEINFCQEFFAAAIVLDGVQLYKTLSAISPVPFACYYKNNFSELICASPERFLKKTGNELLSQPIKGTIKRQLDNEIADHALKEHLKQSGKDQSENVMVVDMVRNDMSRVCIEGSVRVEELFGVYSFPQVHQMISSIVGTLKKGISFSAIIDATYPMGSMTGAPKHRVMELITEHEHQPRGLFSGAVGYIDPTGNFDFNVVIRSLFYNNQTNYLRYLVGSGITIYSNPQEEYEECLLKAKALEQVLGN